MSASPENSSPMRRAVIQTLAILHDAYRELSAKRLFWITLVLSLVAIGAFAVVGVQGNQITIAGYELETGPFRADSLYKYVFNQVMVQMWLTWAAAILAIVSTASIFPDFISGGAIDLYLARPISRLRLFFTKYLAGLLFVVLQVTVFSVAAFFIVGIRGKFWAPGMFMAIPIIALFFSYLWAVCVLCGLLTRSTIASLLLTILVWGIIFGIHFSEVRLLAMENVGLRRIAAYERHLKMLDDRVTKLGATTQPTTATTRALNTAQSDHERITTELEQIKSNNRTLHRFHVPAYAIKLIGPKTTETTDLLERYLIGKDEFTELMESFRELAPPRGRHREPFDDTTNADPGAEIERIKRERSVSWVIGTSLAFELAVLGIASWIFCRRDF